MDNEDNNHTCGPSRLEAFNHFYHLYHAYVGLSICVMGIFSNVSIISVLFSKRMKSNTNAVLLWIAMVDLLMMVVCLPTYVQMIEKKLDPFDPAGLFWKWYPLVYSAILVVCHSSCVWLTVALAAFRLVHLKVQQKMTSSNASAHRVSAAIVATSLLLAVPHILVYRQSSDILTLMESESQGNTSHNLSQSNLGDEMTLVNASYWISALYARFVPSGLLIVLTVSLLRQVRLASIRRRRLHNLRQGSCRGMLHRRRDSRTTLLLTFVASTFLFVELPLGVIFMLSANDSCFYSNVYYPLGDAIDNVTLLKNLVNFVMLTSMSKRFRLAFLEQAKRVIMLLTKVFLCQNAAEKRSRKNTTDKQYKTLLVNNVVQFIEIERNAMAQHSDETTKLGV